MDPVLDAARESGLLRPGRPVLVLLSGGRDSTCLLDVAIVLAGRDVTRALHVNHGLRAGADADEAHCRALCARLGVTLDVERAPARPATGNLQAWARDVRYRAALARAGNPPAEIATGHTASDQAETVLYRLAASPGRRALLGIPAREGPIVRPLLAVTRAQTAAHCSARGLTWREDPTNDDPAYARNRVRHDLLPALGGLHPAAEANVVRTAATLREEAAVLDELVDGALEGADRIALERLGALPPALARLVVARLAEDAAGGPVAGAGRRAPELAALAGRPGSAELHLPGGVRALVEYGVLRMAGPAAPAPAPVVLTVPGDARFGSWELSCAPAAPAREPGVLNAGALGEQVLVRPWRPGDRMRPLGLGGSRSLQDLFTDRRVPRARRASVPVVEADGEIAYVPGVALGERFRITPATRRAVRITAREEQCPGRP